ncbi:MAG: hypothetical protein IT205_00450 [Fimbriimonadaceae bacterium]|nr:hypothetical protein [Fimbriimonadaceae bacterium]
MRIGSKLDPKSYDELRALISEFETELSHFSSDAMLRVLGTLWLFMGVNEIHEEFGLTSPLKQTTYLLGMLLNSPEPRIGRDLGKSEMQQLFNRVEEIFDYYVAQFFQEIDGAEPERLAKLAKTQIGMAVILDYINTPRISGTHEQVMKKLDLQFSPFDEYLENSIGLSATEIRSFISVIGNQLQSKVDELQLLVEAKKNLQAQMKKLGTSPTSDSEALTKQLEVIEQHYGASVFSWNHISKSALLAHFDQSKIDSFWSFFTCVRGRTLHLVHPDDTNILFTKPLVQLDDDVAAAAVFNQLAHAAVAALDDQMRTSPVSAKYFKNRDRTLESEAATIIASILPDAQIYQSLYDSPDSQFEHDLIVSDPPYLLVLEAKASTLRPPFRDVLEGYERLTSDFSGDKGIQKAYNQAERVSSKIRAGIDVPLYSKKGEVQAVLSAAEFSHIHSICLTAEDWGYLATCLDLLVREEGGPHPWAPNLMDMEGFVDALLHRGWGREEFYRFVFERQQLYPRVRSEDEMTYCGWFINRGTLEQLVRAKGAVFLSIDEADVFDKIEAEQRGGPKATYDQSAVIQALEERLPTEFRAEVERRQRAAKKRCACGSGRMYKNCCQKKEGPQPKRTSGTTQLSGSPLWVARVNL